MQGMPPDDENVEASSERSLTPQEREAVRQLVQDELKKSQPPATTQGAPDPEWLTIPEVAKLLRISRGAAYQAIERGEVPGVRRIGKLIRVRRKALLGE